MALQKLEVRTVTELRAEGEGDEMALVGYAARFNTLSRNLGGFVEKIAPGAFTRSLAGNADVKVTFNHDPNQVLGRTKSGTATVTQDDKGLAFRCQLDPTNTMHRNLYASVKRGDIDECSFAFRVAKDGDSWTAEAASDNQDFMAVRTLKDVDLVDVSAVTYPAYYGTTVDARALFPEGDAEIRSAASAIVTEAKRARDESLEAQLGAKCQAISEALVKQFGRTENGNRKFYGPCETYDDHIIASSYDENYNDTYFNIPYTMQDGGFVFGEPKQVELDWVPSERATKLIAEYRSMAQKAAGHDAMADAHGEAAAAHQKESDEHKAAADAIRSAQTQYRLDNGLLDDEDYEDDVLCSPEECHMDDCDEDQRKAKLLELGTACRAHADYATRGEKVRTKKVGGKNLTADKFAYVGDAEDTSTWKFPIHDADHARNALARWNQAKGIPEEKKAGAYRKIVKAAKKFGIEVSDDDQRSAIAATALGEEEKQDRLQRLRLLMNTPVTEGD